MSPPANHRNRLKVGGAAPYQDHNGKCCRPERVKQSVARPRAAFQRLRRTM
jgi:hypothetical protein